MTETCLPLGSSAATEQWVGRGGTPGDGAQVLERPDLSEFKT